MLKIDFLLLHPLTEKEEKTGIEKAIKTTGTRRVLGLAARLAMLTRIISFSGLMVYRIPDQMLIVFVEGIEVL